MAVKGSKTYTVTFSSTDNVYGEQQLFRSIYESLYAVSQEDAELTPVSELEEQQKEVAMT